MTSLYEILEVSPNARAAVIKVAYRCLVQQYHPDKNSADPAANARLSLINQAYAVLADPALRAKYDAELGARKAERRGNGRKAPANDASASEHGKAVRRFVFRSIG